MHSSEKRINDAPERKIRTFFHLTQAHTYGTLALYEDNGSITKEKNTKHLENIYRFLSWSVKAIEKDGQPYTVKNFGIIDTLHLTHLFRPGVLQWEDIAEYNKKTTLLYCAHIPLI